MQEGSDLDCPKRVTQAINTAFDNVDTYLKTVCPLSCLSKPQIGHSRFDETGRREDVDHASRQSCKSIVVHSQ